MDYDADDRNKKCYNIHCIIGSIRDIRTLNRGDKRMNFHSFVFLLYFYCCCKGTTINKYVERNIPGRGIGLVARKIISKGELVIEEKPLIAINTEQSWFKPSDSYSASKIGKEFSNLNEADKNSFASLSQ